MAAIRTFFGYGFLAFVSVCGFAFGAIVFISIIGALHTLIGRRFMKAEDEEP